MLCRARSQSVVSISFKYIPPSLRVISDRESSGIIRKLSSFITWVLERRCFARIPCFRNPILQSVHINDRGFIDDKFVLVSSETGFSTTGSDYFMYSVSEMVARLHSNLTELISISIYLYIIYIQTSLENWWLHTYNTVQHTIVQFLHEGFYITFCKAINST